MTGVTNDPNDPRLSRGVDAEPVPQAEVYLVLSELDRAAGFVRPVRSAYVHRYWLNGDTDPLPVVLVSRAGLGGCGGLTVMARPIAETYARQPGFYGATYCVPCAKHLPVAQFRWDADGTVVGS